MNKGTKTESADGSGQSQNQISPASFLQPIYDRDTSIFTPPPPDPNPTDSDDDTCSSSSAIGEQESESEGEEQNKKTVIKKYGQKSNPDMPKHRNLNLEPPNTSNPMQPPPETELSKLMQGFLVSINTNLNNKFDESQIQLGKLNNKLDDNTQKLQANFNNKLDDNTQKLQANFNNKLDDNTQKLNDKLDSKLDELDKNTQEQLAQLQYTLMNIETKIRQEFEAKLEETNVKIVINANKIVTNTCKITETNTKLEKLKTQVETRIQKIEKTLTETKDIIDKENNEYKNLKTVKQKIKDTVTWTVDQGDDTTDLTTEKTYRHSNRPSNSLTSLLKEDKPIFDGSNPERFLERLESFLKGFTMTKQELIDSFHIFLKNKPLQWWNLIRMEVDSWEEVRDRILTYWVDKDKVKETWDRLTFKTHFDIERFILTALELQNQLKPDRPMEKKIEKITLKLPSPIKEALFIKKAKTIEQFLVEVKDFRKLFPVKGIQKYNTPPSPKRTLDRVIYNSNFRHDPYYRTPPHTPPRPKDSYYRTPPHTPTRPKDSYYRTPPHTPPRSKDNYNLTPPRQLDSPYYNWDTAGNAYDPGGVCVWENKFDHPQKGKKYLGAIVSVDANDPMPQTTDDYLDAAPTRDWDRSGD